MLGPFEKPSRGNPVLLPDPAAAFHSPMGDSTVHWEGYTTFNPAAVVKGGKVYVLYRAEDASGKQEIGGHTSRIGLARSEDGISFTRRSEPVLYPDQDAQRGNEWPGGVEDPRVVETEDGTYVLMYTQWNRDVPRLAVATSKDLLFWEKHGPAFAQAAGGKYLRTESKSGAILTRVQGDHLVATRVNGKYWSKSKTVTCKMTKPMANNDRYSWKSTTKVGDSHFSKNLVGITRPHSMENHIRK